MKTFNHEEYLMHHGVKGQKWGVRRYQNPDGTLTAAGKKRYGTAENFSAAMEEKAARRRAVRNTAFGVLATAGAVAGAVQGSKAVGSMDKGQRDQLFMPTIKDGKDKPNISPAEKVIKNTNKGVTEAGNILDASERIQTRHDKNVMDLSNMSDEDLRSVINRKNLERQYRDVMTQNNHVGIETTKDILSIVGSVTAIAGAGLAAYQTIRTIKKG